MSLGLTGLAHINGRNEFHNFDNAKYKNDYSENTGFVIDVRFSFGTIFSLLKGRSVRIDKKIINNLVNQKEFEQYKILFVANVAKEHIIKFHIPTIRCFKNNGWIVEVACSGDEKVPECHNQYKMNWERSPFTLKILTGVYQLNKIINDGNYNIVYCHTPVGGVVARLAAKKARKNGTKVIYCAHGLHFYKGAPLFAWLVYYPIEKYLARCSDTLFTVNKEDYYMVKKKFNDKTNIKLVPEVGIDLSRLNVKNICETREKYRMELDIPEKATVLIYVAELISNKNQGMLIDTLSVLNKKRHNTYLLLVGPDHARGKYQEYAKKLNLDKFVKFLGWRSDIGELLHTADICVASSIREGFGINLVEAMYCGLPVIATNNRGHSTIIEDGVNGFLVDINDANSMADKIIVLLRNDTIREKFLGFDVSVYDSSYIANQLYEVINNEL